MKIPAAMTSGLLLAMLCAPAGAWMGPGSDGDDDGASPATAIMLVQMRLSQTGVPSGTTDRPGAPNGMAAEVPPQPNTNPNGPGTIPGVPGAPRIPEVPVSPGTVPKPTTPTTTQPALFPTTSTLPHVP